MPTDADDFERKLREREDRRKLDRISGATHAADQKAVDDFLHRNSQPEFEKFRNAIPSIVERANVVIGNEPHKFIVGSGITLVHRGIANAEVIFSQPWANYGKITLSVSIGATPATPVFSPLPLTRSYEFEPAMQELSGETQVLWRGRSAEMTSEELAKFVVQEVAAYYDEMVRSR